jgi:hypothetical protein
MAHFPKPFFRSARQAWFVQIGDRQIRLAENKDEAFTRYHELMAKSAATPTSVQTDAPPLVVVVIDGFLDWCDKNRQRRPTSGTRTGSIPSVRLSMQERRSIS